MPAFAEVGITLEDLLEKSGDLVHVMDATGKILYANARWLEVLGFKPDTTNFVSQILHPGYHSEFDTCLAQLQQGFAQASIAWTLRSASGQELFVQISLLPRLENGTLQTITCVLHNITDAKRYSMEMEHIFELSMDMVGILSRDGRFEKVNLAWQQTLGYTAAELVGHYFYEFLHPQDYERSVAIAQQTAPGGRITEFENRYRHKDGAYRWLSWNATLYPDDHRIYFIARDITDRKTTEMHLALRNEAIEFSPSAISIADAFLPEMPLIYINPAFERMTGYSTAEVIGQNCRFLQGDDRDQPALNEVRQALREARSCTVTIRNYHKSGELFYNELRLAPIFNTAGVLTHFVGISTDVTERVNDREKIEAQNMALLGANRELARMRLETEQAAEHLHHKNEELLQTNAELAQARKTAEEAARLKTQFLATMSHELRTPLNAIIGYTEIQLAGMTGELTSEQADYQKRVLANADHLLELINDVLDIAKIEAGRLEIINRPFHLRDWLDEVVEQTRGLAEEKGLIFEAVIDERLPNTLISDAARLKQIAINLLSNAFKFTEKGRVRVHIQKHGRDAFKFIVSDTGIGIPSHMQETIFEEFRQVDNTSQRKQGGTGLGLAIVRKLVLMMGGNIRVSSQFGEGSTFTLILPLTEPKTSQIIAEEGSRDD